MFSIMIFRCDGNLTVFMTVLLPPVLDGYNVWRGANEAINIKLQGSQDTFVENQVKQNWSGE